MLIMIVPLKLNDVPIPHSIFEAPFTYPVTFEGNQPLPCYFKIV